MPNRTVAGMSHLGGLNVRVSADFMLQLKNRRSETFDLLSSMLFTGLGTVRPT